MATNMLPLNSPGLIPPHVPTRILGKPQYGPLMFERLAITKAEDWIVNDIEINGKSQLSVKNLPGALFGGHGIRTSIQFSGLDVIESDSTVAVTATYIGEEPNGGLFMAAVVGPPPPQNPTVLPVVTKTKLLPKTATTILVTLEQPLEITTLLISDEGTAGGPADWLVNDICIDGTSMCALAGDIPGDLFTVNAIDTFIRFQPGTQIKFTVTYIGFNEEGCCFSAQILSDVVREDKTQPPPDVRATITCDGAVETAIAHCNWRPPYIGAPDPWSLPHVEPNAP